MATIAPDAAAVPRFHVGQFRWEGVLCAGRRYWLHRRRRRRVCSARPRWPTSFWDAVLAAGIIPAGLGARDTLRLEAALPLHGHELGPGITPLQAGLGWVVGWEKPNSGVVQALEAERSAGSDADIWSA